MKKLFITTFVVLLSGLAGNCASTFFSPLQPAMQPQNGLNQFATTALGLPTKTSSVNSVKISQVERTLFGKTYASQNLASRLARIERAMFNTTYTSAPEVQRIDNIISNYNQINKYPNISSNDLSSLENQVFSQTFPQYSTQRRIERLEQQMLGAVQGGDMTSRYEMLRRAGRNYRPYNNDTLGDYTKKSILRSVANNIGSSLLGGTMTGYSPQIDPYSAYGNNMYGNNYNNYNNLYNSYQPGYGAYQGYRTNRGYSDRFKNYGTGSSVTILD